MVFIIYLIICYAFVMYLMQNPLAPVQSCYGRRPRPPSFLHNITGFHIIWCFCVIKRFIFCLFFSRSILHFQKSVNWLLDIAASRSFSFKSSLRLLRHSLLRSSQFGPACIFSFLCGSILLLIMLFRMRRRDTATPTASDHCAKTPTGPTTCFSTLIWFT